MYAKTDLAWAAGFLDGEGCVRITSQKNGCMFVGLTVSQKKRLPLDRLAQILGGKVYPRTGDVFIWQAHGQKAAEALEKVYPFLILKKEQAHLALLFQKRRPGAGFKRTAEAIKQDKADYALMRTLKV